MAKGPGPGIQNAPASPLPTRDSTNIASRMQRLSSDLYSAEGRQQMIRRMLRSASIRNPQVNQGISIEMFNGEPLMVNPPNGYLPFAMNADKESLEKAINFCGVKKRQYEQSGDWYRMWLYAQRQSFLAGVMNHLIRFKMINQ